MKQIEKKGLITYFNFLLLFVAISIYSTLVDFFWFFTTVVVVIRLLYRIYMYRDGRKKCIILIKSLGELGRFETFLFLENCLLDLILCRPSSSFFQINFTAIFLLLFLLSPNIQTQVETKQKRVIITILYLHATEKKKNRMNPNPNFSVRCFFSFF